MGHPEVVALLLESGANPEIENEFGGTALKALAFRPWREMARTASRPGNADALRPRARRTASPASSS